MKCPSCYADYPSEEPRCPYCGAENPRYQKKVEQEKKWEDQYQKKKSEVLASSRLLIVKRALNGLILGGVAVFVICLVLSVAWELRSDSRQEEQQGGVSGAAGSLVPGGAVRPLLRVPAGPYPLRTRI